MQGKRNAGSLRQTKEAAGKPRDALIQSISRNPQVLEMRPPPGSLETLGTVPKEYSRSRPRSRTLLRGHPAVSSFDLTMLSAALNSCLTRAIRGEGGSGSLCPPAPYGREKGHWWEKGQAVGVHGSRNVSRTFSGLKDRDATSGHPASLTPFFLPQSAGATEGTMPTSLTQSGCKPLFSRAKILWEIIWLAW